MTYIGLQECNYYHIFSGALMQEKTQILSYFTTRKNTNVFSHKFQCFLNVLISCFVIVNSISLDESNCLLNYK